MMNSSTKASVFLARRKTSRKKRVNFRVGRVCAIAVSLCSLVAVTACKTSKDASAAAAQMTETAEALGAYYAALHSTVKQTGQLYIVQEAMVGIPYGDADKKQIADAAAELAKREELAETLSSLATAFSGLTGSKASTSATTSATALQAEVDSLKNIGSAATVADALSAATGTLVKALQEGKEREAAKAMAGTISALDDLFKKEKPACESLGAAYYNLAQSLAKNLIDRGQVDESFYVKDALGPFGLTANVTSPDLKAKIDVIAKANIDSIAEEKQKHFYKASDAMEKALGEMSRRIDLVAGEKPMTIRAVPASLTTVNQWAGVTAQK